MNDFGEINYCYNYLQRLGMNTLAVAVSMREQNLYSA